MQSLDLLDLELKLVAGVDAENHARIELDEDFGDEWVEAFCACGGCEDRKGIIGRILGNVTPTKIVASLSVDGRIAACGYGALDRGFVGLFDIVVDRGMRRRGLGEAIVRSILERARELGAGHAYLQVMIAMPQRRGSTKRSDSGSYTDIGTGRKGLVL